MIIVNKLYRKELMNYTSEDWKYIFSIYTLRDKYNFTEEEFLAAELVDKVIILKKMDDNLFVKGTIDIDLLHENESVFAPCPQDEGCKVIQDFLEDENVKDENPYKYEIPACNSENNCEIIQDFLKDENDSFTIYRDARREYQDAMTTCENRIEQFKQNIRTEIQEISIHQQRYNEALQTYLK